MSNVTLTIGGRQFVVACADGEEDHVGTLGRRIDAKLAGMDGLSGQSESRMLLFAALLLADEVHELRQQIEGATASPGLGPRLSALAGRLENLASHLEDGAGDA
jgi:cell division protein ZapA